MERVDSIRRALILRKTLINPQGKVLVTDFSDTIQGADTSKIIDLMQNVNTKESIFRVKGNIKAIDPVASKAYGVDFVDISKMQDREIQDFLKVQEFDFPLWFKKEKQFSMKDVTHYNLPFIMQVAGCNFHDGSDTGGCTFCFVDNKSNDGLVASGKTYLGVKDAVESFSFAREKFKEFYKNKHNFNTDMKVFRVSGGEPTLTLDWVLNLWREIEKQGLEGVVGQIDSNLSTGSVVQIFENEGIYENNILNKLAQYPVRILTALKGTDAENLQDNVQSTTTMEEQIYSLSKFLEAGFDIYPQMYNPNPATFGKYLRRLEEHFSNISMKIHVGPLKVYGPTKARLESQAKMLGVNPLEYVDKITSQWDSNYELGCEVIDSFLQARHGVSYKEVARPDVEIKIKN